jgi:16S rRNA (cytosine967-C5)-methyltransferase
VKHLPGKSLPGINNPVVPAASKAREAALNVLNAVRRGQFAEHALSRILDIDALGREDRALTTEIVYGVLRWRSRLDSVIDHRLDKPTKKLHLHVREVLRIALYQIIFLDRIPHRAVVDQAVTQIKSRFGLHTAAFVNGLLRSVLRVQEVVDPTPGRDPRSLAIYYSHPMWLVKRWLKDFGHDTAVKILMSNNSRSPLVLRVNRLKISPDKLYALLDDHGIPAGPAFPVPDAIKISHIRSQVSLIPGYAEGLFAVQEGASQMIAPLLASRHGERILDACAAPGGKTAHLAALARNDVEITATDIDAVRLEETKKNLHRLGVTCAQLRLGDVRNPKFVGSLGTFDKILLDAPCSNLGVLRHNPEVRYRIQETDLPEFARTQLKILKSVSGALRVGGKLIYSVCTTTAEETTGVLKLFLESSPEYSTDPIQAHEVLLSECVDREGFLKTFPSPEENPLDGFFAARITRCCKMCE